MRAVTVWRLRVHYSTLSWVDVFTRFRPQLPGSEGRSGWDGHEINRPPRCLLLCAFVCPASTPPAKQTAAEDRSPSKATAPLTRLFHHAGSPTLESRQLQGQHGILQLAYWHSGSNGGRCAFFKTALTEHRHMDSAVTAKLSHSIQ